MDFSDISDTIIGLIIGGAAIWSYVISPMLKKQSGKSENSHTQERPGPTAFRMRTRQAPLAARTVAAEHISEAATFTPWPTAPSEAPRPLAVETAPAPFISGEEGIRATSDADAGMDAQLAAMSDAPSAAADLLGSEPEDLRRGVIWAEILSPKFKE